MTLNYFKLIFNGKMLEGHYVKRMLPKTLNPNSSTISFLNRIVNVKLFYC
jgi:hypothetical protein